MILLQFDKLIQRKNDWCETYFEAKASIKWLLDASIEEQLVCVEIRDAVFEWEGQTMSNGAILSWLPLETLHVAVGSYSYLF
jgi:hypothetical protein